MLRKLFYIACSIFIVNLAFISLTGCVKEYSYEGGPAQDTIPITDTVTIPSIEFPVCAECKGVGDIVLGKWSYRYDTFLLCGNITDAVLAPDRNGFTFFGPSACSIDTGIILTVYLKNNVLDKDMADITTNQVIFDYYDRKTPSDIFLAPIPLFSLTIDTYEYATRIAKGKFSGYANMKDSSRAFIKDGKFEIKFK